jgi:hypothetical protein
MTLARGSIPGFYRESRRGSNGNDTVLGVPAGAEGYAVRNGRLPIVCYAFVDGVRAIANLSYAVICGSWECPPVAPKQWHKLAVFDVGLVPYRQRTRTSNPWERSGVPTRNGSLICRAAEMALFGTKWHGLRGRLCRNAKAKNELRQIKK